MVRQTDMVNLKICWISVIVLFFSFPGKAHWNSFSINYSKDLYGRGSQTWGIDIYDENWVYFANNNGLVGFNGYEWSLYPLGNRSEVRSLCVSTDKGIIYVGGESEFGYFEPNASGELVFHNLSASFTDQYHLYGGYWGVYEVDHLVYFVSDKFIAKSVEDRLIPIYSDHKIDCSAVAKGVLYVGTTQGLQMVIGNSLLPVPGTELLNGKNIRAIAPYRDGFLVATAMNGLYYYSNTILKQYITGEEDFIQENEIFSLTVYNEMIAIGTIHKGLLLLDESNGSKRFFNEYNGLQNNTILSVAFDKWENIWLGLDNGISSIPLNDPFTNLYAYPYSKGTGYSVVIRNNRIYLGTNRGLFYTSYPVEFTDEPHDFRLIPGLIGQVWSLEEIDNTLFCLHDKGLYIVDNDNNIKQIPEIRGALTLIQDKDDSELMWVGCYDGLYMVRYQNEEWRFVKKVENLNEWMKGMVFDESGDLWLRMINYGYYRYAIDKEEGRVLEREFYSMPLDNPVLEGLYIYTIGNETVFVSTEGFFKFDPAHKKIETHPGFNKLFLPGESYKAIRQYKDKVYALSDKMVQVATFDPEGNYLHTYQYLFNKHKIGLIPYYETLEIVDDTKLIIPNENGFAFLDCAQSDPEWYSSLFINKIYLTYPKDSVLYADSYRKDSHEYKIPFRHNALRFEFGVRALQTGEDIQFRYRLLPDVEWSDYTVTNVKEYNNLKEGKYHFEAEAVYPDGNLSSILFSFTILPPWYRSTTAYVIYMIIVFTILWGAYRWGEYHIQKKNLRALEEKDKEIEEKEQHFNEIKIRQEQKITALKNEKLEQELKHKSQEMANLTINLSRKNEALLEIKQELYKVINDMKGESVARHKRLLLTINNNIDVAMQSDDLLKRFEEQFNLVHNNFMQKLSDKHPDLTLSERKMCAYLKMNLSSKEIAPLLNLSVRGVETLRYRLRKKLNLGREDGLTEYLNSIK